MSLHTSFIQFSLQQSAIQETSGYSFTLSSPLPGALLFCPHDLPADAHDVLLSVGVHGNETAPIEILEHIVRDLLTGQLALRQRLLVVLANPHATRLGVRYAEYDLNRLFGSGAHDTLEAQRAVALERLAESFYQDATRPRVHLDLHTALRGSVYERFAIYPYTHGAPLKHAWLAWLKAAGMDAALLHHAPAHTFSYFTRHYYQADSFTLELGAAHPFGQNELSHFHLIEQTLRHFLSTPLAPTAVNAPLPDLFRTKYDLIKHSPAFQLHLADDIKNFTRLADGQRIAEDGEVQYQAQGGQERILFPNPTVQVGLRAGIVIEPISWAEVQLA